MSSSVPTADTKQSILLKLSSVPTSPSCRKQKMQSKDKQSPSGDQSSEVLEREKERKRERERERVVSRYAYLPSSIETLHASKKHIFVERHVCHGSRLSLSNHAVTRSVQCKIRIDARDVNVKEQNIQRTCG